MQSLPALRKIDANIDLSTQHVWHGVTQTAEKVALSGNLDFTVQSDISAGIWGCKVDDQTSNHSQYKLLVSQNLFAVPAND